MEEQKKINISLGTSVFICIVIIILIVGFIIFLINRNNTANNNQNVNLNNNIVSNDNNNKSIDNTHSGDIAQMSLNYTITNLQLTKESLKIDLNLEDSDEIKLQNMSNIELNELYSCIISTIDLSYSEEKQCEYSIKNLKTSKQNDKFVVNIELAFNGNSYEYLNNKFNTAYYNYLNNYKSEHIARKSKLCRNS